MSEDKEPREFTIHLEGTAAKIQAKKEAILSGREPLIKGRAYDSKTDSITWDILEKRREDFLDFYCSPKQLLDIKLRAVQEKDLTLPSPPGTNRKELLSAIQGGLNSVDLNFLESSLLHAIVEAFSKTNYPEKIELSRAGLYELMGIEKRLLPSGRRAWKEGGAFWRTRNKYHNALLGLGGKSWPFIFRWRQKEDKKGEPVYSLALTYEAIIKVKAIYHNVKDPELPGFALEPKTREGHFSHYEIRLNPAAIGEVNHYFRYLPSSLGHEISEFRKGRGQRASVIEFNFIEFLYAMADPRSSTPEIIEINYLKLAGKLKIKIKKFRNPAEIRWRVRQILSRCYETALTLRFALEIHEGQAAARGETKEVIRLNPERFKYLDQRRLFEGETEA